MTKFCYGAVMLELAKVNEVVNRAAASVLGRTAGIRRVISEPTADAEGQDALRITIVLKRGSGDRISRVDPLDTLIGIRQALRAANDERFPIIDYVTEEELEAEAGADIES